jgi:peroxiredoxin
MRPRFLALLPLALATATVASARFELSGQLPEGHAATTVTVLRESLEDRSTTPVATAPVEAGRRFSVTVDAEAGLFKLQAGEAAVPFVAAPGQSLRVTSDAAGLQITGSNDQDLYRAYEAFRAASLARTVTPVRAELSRLRAAGNTAEIERLTEAEVTAYNTHRFELTDFTLATLTRSPALYAASLRWDGDYRLDELAAAVAHYATAHPTLETSRLLQERIARFRATALGAIAPPLSGPTPAGETIALADLRGRHVLVDFWASWCPPCRIENRHYVELYRTYRDAGFEILAVSVDQNERAWKQAIAQDQATWKHLSDLSGWRTPLAAAYNIAALPANFLLDPDGRIIAKNLRGDALDAFLAQRLKPDRR